MGDQVKRRKEWRKVTELQKRKWKVMPNLPIFLRLPRVRPLYLSNHHGEIRDSSLHIVSKYT